MTLSKLINERDKQHVDPQTSRPGTNTKNVITFPWLFREFVTDTLCLSKMLSIFRSHLYFCINRSQMYSQGKGSRISLFNLRRFTKTQRHRWFSKNRNRLFCLFSLLGFSGKIWLLLIRFSVALTECSWSFNGLFYGDWWWRLGALIRTVCKQQVQSPKYSEDDTDGVSGNNV